MPAAEKFDEVIVLSCVDHLHDHTDTEQTMADPVVGLLAAMLAGKVPSFLEVSLYVSEEVRDVGTL